eukprot:5005081-Prymnesium_polylepis.3
MRRPVHSRAPASKLPPPSAVRDVALASTRAARRGCGRAPRSHDAARLRSAVICAARRPLPASARAT